MAWLDSFFEYLSDSFRPILGVLLGALRVLVNNCRSRLRTSRRRETLPLWEELPAPEPAARPLWEELRALPPQDRAAIHLFYYEGFSTQEIARILKCRPGTVRSRLSRARKRLRERLDPK